MQQCSSLTILFDDPFWIGLYERTEGDSYEACKIIFGSEPKDTEVYEYMLANWHRLKFSPSVRTVRVDMKKTNPKRMQREIKKSLENRGIGTKAQQAMKLLHEQCVAAGRERKKEDRENEKQRQYELRQEKKKAKHRGR